jgi:hypothetical protein
MPRHFSDNCLKRSSRRRAARDHITHAAMHPQTDIRNLSSVSSGPFALKLHFHLELSRLPRVLFGGRDSQARTAEF